MTDEVRDGAMFELPEQTQEVRIGAREFAQEFVIEGATERDHSHRYPKEIVRIAIEFHQMNTSYQTELSKMPRQMAAIADSGICFGTP